MAAPALDTRRRRKALRLEDIQATVTEELAQVSAEMWRWVSTDAPLLRNMSTHLMAMRGKMFRPTLVLLSSCTAGRSDRRAVQFAGAIELIHLATLVHDDAVDHSVLRRGLPTLNALFGHQRSVIMGDFLYSTALHQLVELQNLHALEILTRASTEMSIGELRQMGSPSHLQFSETDYLTVIRAKTASLMSAACEIGAVCGAPEYQQPLACFGEALGMAFQIVDDLLDYTETEATMGKPSGLDLREKKVTLPLIATLRRLPIPSRRRVDELFASEHPSDEAILDVMYLVREYDGLGYARARGEEYARDAERALDPLPPSMARSALVESISYVMERHA